MIDVEGSDAVQFPRYAPDELAGLSREVVQRQLLASGQWTALAHPAFQQNAGAGQRAGGDFRHRN
ncbi:Na(+)-translocating NADH-quinone reductase subunit A [Raoultella terrigena]|uniref:Na(+)-translocating NADH-quinone reductase subunit A n=1 Tax=Raoultella terrigena TaxID=577 RepID=A0A4U9DDW7_RAOTE|nr:Na(+)-translocating NADH-quinone reductase subunit A [Raoultella terrigena]